MSEQSMIERVARAAYFAGEGVQDGPANDAHWAHWWSVDREEHEAVGRAAINAMPGWEPIKTAPKDGDRILLGWHGEMSAEGYWHDGSKNYWKLAGFYFADDDLLTGKPASPECWMLLPVPPAAALKPEVQP